ncbi:mandelate racemase/muconate lactonizing enzyme family protein [Halorarum halophilum]|uniref:Mandelate racemase/muconate lactonizing enzyme family protein n=1 Tax=Halorarum halophilum TaxID=2743090 RepID=A0A7D5H048_9EURY|nr:mandelate racemase/muconate lactonizing enzyme family protein [Halobaculum halophilum]QLG27813.1 mandelate racemase/muconate lactonizing enzyme family protein [Halobaculum halophilum]
MSEVSITDVETYIVANPWKPWVFVRLETDAGVTGLAEATTHDKPRTVAASLEEMSDYFVGKDPFDTEQIWLEMYRDEWFSKNVINTTVCSAVDMACWDIKGKLLDKPVYELLGGKVHGDRLRTYANGWYTDAHGEPEGFARAAERVVDDGYDAMKFDPFGTAWQSMSKKDKNHAVDIVGAVRDAVGPDVDLLIECHGRFSAGQAVDIARKLDEFEPTWFEEPCPPDSINSLAEVARKSPIPVATGERHISKHDFFELVTRTEIDVFQPDLMNTGGITEGKKIAGLAEADHVDIAPHNPQGPVASAIYSHFCASIPNFRIQELFQTYDVEWVDELLVEPLVVEDGYMEIPEGPGFGIELDMDVVEEHAYTEDQVHTINLFEKGWETRELE